MVLQLWQSLRNDSALTLPPDSLVSRGRSSNSLCVRKGVRGNTIQEIKIQKFHLSTIKTSHCFTVSKCFQEPFNSPKPQQNQTPETRTSEPETWGFPKYPRVRKYVSPGSVPSVPVREICLTGSNNAKKP